MMSLALVSVIDGDRVSGRKAVEMALKTVGGPIKKGHVPFGHDLARCAIVYDLCHELWTPDERAAFHHYVNQTVDANVDSETHVFHNGWYGYKNWGIGLACYATYLREPAGSRDSPSPGIGVPHAAAPALELAGDGGGWGEGYYVNYWLYEWLFFCEVARWCEGVDYYAMRHPNSFETARRGQHVRDLSGHRHLQLAAADPDGRRRWPRLRRRPRQGALRPANPRQPFPRRPGSPGRPCLQRDDAALQRGRLRLQGFPLARHDRPQARLWIEFRLSHISPGPGYVYARSSWDDDATYFFFKCGDRFTAHQHLDVGHFLIYKHEELAGDGGHYDGLRLAARRQLPPAHHRPQHDPGPRRIRALARHSGGQSHRQRRRPSARLAAPQRGRRRRRGLAQGPGSLRHRRHSGVRGSGRLPLRGRRL